MSKIKEEALSPNRSDPLHQFIDSRAHYSPKRRSKHASPKISDKMID